MSTSTSETSAEVVEEREASTTEARDRREHRRRNSRHLLTGSTLELIGGAGGLVLALIALAGVGPHALISIATIAIGAGLIGHGAVVASRLHRMPEPAGATEQQVKIGEAAGDEVLGGTAAIALGVLALLGIEPLLLLGVATIVLGGAIVFAAASRPELPLVPKGAVVEGRRAPLIAASVALVVAGLAGVTLGIIAMAGVHAAHTLIEIGLLCVAGALLASALATGAAFSRRGNRRVVEHAADRTVEDERLAPTGA